MDTTAESHRLVAEVRAAAAAHHLTWDLLVPDAFTVNDQAEAQEEAAYAGMAAAKARLRDHICATYGISARELATLALP